MTAIPKATVKERVRREARERGRGYMDCALRWMMRLFFGIVLGRGLRFAHEVEKRGSPSQAALRRFQGKRLRTHTYLGDNAQAEVWRAEQKMDFE